MPELSVKWKQGMEKIGVRKEGIFRKKGAGVTKIPTVILSVGGLGGRTLNMLKRKMVHAYGESDHVWYLAIDTMQKELEDLTDTEKGGYLEENETILIFDPTIGGILVEPGACPPHINQWRQPGKLQKRLNNTGAQQIRQIGRIMLTAGNSYSRLRNHLQSILSQAIRKAGTFGLVGEVNIIVVAGISGGTGSGMTIDISYLVRDVMEHALAFTNYSLSSYFYMPDAQYNEPGIAGNNAVLFNLRRNGYAALKEIDYFLNLEKNKGRYRLDLGDGAPVESEKNIFDSCTLVSGVTVAGAVTLSQTIDVLTDDLREILGDIVYQDQGGTNVQLAKAFSSNIGATLNTWYATHADKTQYPKSTDYNYQVLGYSSVSIPKDEIIHYCINKMYLAMIEEFYRMSALRAQDMEELLRDTYLEDADALFQYAYNLIDTELGIDTPAKREVKRDEDGTLEAAMDAAGDCAAAVNQEWEEQIFRMAETVKVRFDQCFDKNGPFFALKLLEHEYDEPVAEGQRRFRGLLEHLKWLSLELQNRSNTACAVNMDSEIRSARNDAITGFGRNTAELENYRDVCCAYALTKRVDAKIYGELAKIVNALYQRYLKENNNVYQVYTKVLTEISKMMDRDADYITDPHETIHPTGATYYYDVLNLRKAGGETDRLMNYLKGFISPVRTEELAKTFIKDLRDNKDIWIDVDDSDALRKEIRDIFKEFVDKILVTDAIEKFLVVAYSNTELSIEDVDDIWANDPATKTSILARVASNIASHLKTQSIAMARLATGYQMGSFTVKKYVGVLRSTPELSDLIRTQFAGDPTYQVAESNLEDRISCTTLAFGLPLYPMWGMAELNRDYETALGSSLLAEGLHMDEVNEKWQEFPQPYNLDYSVRVDRGFITESTRREKELLVHVKEKADQALANGCISFDRENRNYVLYNIVREPSEPEKFAAKMREEYDPETSLHDFMRRNGYDLRVIPIVRDNNGLDPVELTGEGSTVEIGDFYKLIRLSRYMTMTLERNADKFDWVEGLRQERIQIMAVTGSSVRRLGIFANALKTGVVSREDGIWKYLVGEQEELLADLSRGSNLDKKYSLYHAFAGFCRLSQDTVDEIDRTSAQMRLLSDDGGWAKEIGDCRGRNGLGKLGAESEIQKQVRISQCDYNIALSADNISNPYRALREVYDALDDYFA